MIWDRFDDAHDAELDDIHDEEASIRDLETKLKAVGITYDPFTEPESGNEPGPQGWYNDTVRRKFALIAYRKYLAKLLEDRSD